ncbi:cysteine hydrolase family protein [Undibacterium sp. TS12]|uniref:cysteine hydrolase family protein n=1 Tax=Undibacterium sp. TS12 TaxID=2908202 RepID=UPI001F4C842B|nr:cysteine hydrolase family protein [Undibacterium sp. TS12]MCH8621847.1 cysteine hydrolase [Undibacterium sp. TS12]
MDKHNTALIIIDMQRGMADPKSGTRNNPQAEDNMRQILAAWRAASAPIVHVRHMSLNPQSVFWPGQPGNEFQDSFKPYQGEHIVEKNITDAFLNTGLERWLHVRGIKSVVMVGVSSNNSVEASARTASNLGFATTVVADACFAFDRIDIKGRPQSAEEVHVHAMTNLQDEYARVVITSALLA